MTIATRTRYAGIAAILILVVTAGAHWLPKLWASTLPLTARIAADEGGTWRTVPVRQYSNLNVVVHRNVAWCMCPGLGVITQLSSMDLDSAFAKAVAIFGTFAAEGARGPGQCLTVKLEVGSGEHPPWARRAVYTFSWHLRPDGQWVFFGYGVPETDYKTAHARKPGWETATAVSIASQ